MKNILFFSYKKRGFTIIELLVVVSIISLLSSVLFSSVSGVRLKGRDGFRISAVHEVEKALELYYANHGNYPPNIAPLDVSTNIPINWASMIKALNAENLIKATVSSLEGSKYLEELNVTKTAYASVGPPTEYYSTIQDPFYKTNADFLYSFGYVVTANRLSYKIRVYLEDPNSPIFANTFSGAFLDLTNTTTTGLTACDKALSYYCIFK